MLEKVEIEWERIEREVGENCAREKTEFSLGHFEIPNINSLAVSKTKNNRKESMK